MPTNKNSKVEDDYYSNLKEDKKSGDTTNKPEKKEVKPKIKAKVKKKVVKKDETKTPEIQKTVRKKPSLTLLTKEEKEEIKKISPRKNNSRKDNPRKNNDKVVRNSKKTDSKNSKIEAPKLDTSDAPVDIVDKTFSKKKPKKFIKSEDKKPSNGKKKPVKKYKKEEKFEDFTRSHILQQKKKQEKSIEDMNQTLKDRTGGTVVLPDVISVKEFSEKTGIPITRLMAEFMKNGMMVNLNSSIDFETASIVAEAFEIKIERDNSSGVSIDDILTGNLTELLKEDDDSKLESRPPVISIMGHVDHGKTSLLDYVRQAKVADGEAGGITQSIGAYQVDVRGQKITFLDTPGHEAFTVMRARGAKSTDIAILVVAADEGVKPQTIESISHAKEAGIPVVVAVNKMDKDGANPDHVKGQLAEHGLVPDDWGGDTPMIPVSAKSGDGIDDLLETLALVAEMQEIKANPSRNAIGTVIESHLDKKLGPVSTVLINAGTLAKGDNIVCGSSFGKVKILKNHLSKNVDSAIPGDPALIVGLDRVVEGGDILQSVATPDLARKKSAEFEEIIKAKKAQSQSGLEVLMSRIKSGMLKNLKIVVKADTNGSLEAVKNALLKISDDEVRITIAHAGVGNINESDVLMASASQTIIVGFNVGLVGKAQSMIDDAGIEFINHRVIYHITERIEAIATGMLDPKEVEITLGDANVKAIFYDGKKYMVAGLGIEEGNVIEAGAKVRVLRGDKIAGKGTIDNLKQGVEDVTRLEGPIECGIQFTGDTKLQEGDILEMYKIEIQK